MKDKKPKQLSLSLETGHQSQADGEEKPAPGARVISLPDRKAERDNAEERKLFKKILGSVKHF